MVYLFIYRGLDILGLYSQVTKRTRWMPWQSEAKKDVVICDKLRGVDNRRYNPGISEWGNPPVIRQVSYGEYIAIGGERGELKHLSTLRKRNQLRFPQ